MEITKTKLDGVLLIKPGQSEDFRGSYAELYNKKLYQKDVVPVDFVQDDASTSAKDILLGIHGDDRTWKLVTCLSRRFYVVVVDPSKVQWESFIITESNRFQVLIPPKFGTGHLALAGKSVLYYKQSTYYDPKGQFTLKWNDPKLGIWWPIKNPVLSRRDEEGHYI